MSCLSTNQLVKKYKKAEVVRGFQSKSMRVKLLALAQMVQVNNYILYDYRYDYTI